MVDAARWRRRLDEQDNAKAAQLVRQDAVRLSVIGRACQQPGMFHVGGATCCLLFRPDTLPACDLFGHAPGVDAQATPVNARIAMVHAVS